MRLALAQVDPKVGDIAGNTRLVLAAVREAAAQGADVTLLPELVLTGYPPEDLLAKGSFVRDNRTALDEVAAACGKPALVGFVDSSPDGRLFNAAALCAEGRVRGVYHKRRLPNYGVFDEERYFDPGADLGLGELGDVTIGTTICEDVWVPELVAADGEHGASLVLNISASPFHAGKGVEREEMLRGRARDNGVWLAYCNLVGGQDELVFDGRSVVISPAGEVVARAKAFEPDLVVVEFEPKGRLAPAEDVAPMRAGADEVYAALRLGLGDYLRKNGFTDVVIGLSGGIDSALTATLATDAIGPAHVHGVLMPSAYSSEGSVTDARALADNLGIDVREIRIEKPYEAFLAALKPSFDDLPFDIAEENLQARVRGTLLMGLSNKFGWLVLATGNKSELSVGYSTLYGDMVGGFAPLKDVFKMRVYELARWRNTRAGGAVIPEASITKAPSAELRPGQTDQQSLPPYELLDAILERYVEQDASREEIVADGFDADVVARVCRLVDAAEYKRRQGPLGIKITPKAFGKDRRMPVTNGYRG